MSPTHPFVIALRVFFIACLLAFPATMVAIALHRLGVIP